MTVQIDTTAENNALRLVNQGVAPAAPSVNHTLLYIMTGTNSGLYIENDAGQKIGPFITGTVAPGAGSLVLLEQYTATGSASISFISSISSTYDDYMIEFINVAPASNAQDFIMRMGSGTFDSGANYTRLGWYNGTADVFTQINSTGQTSILIASAVRNDANNLTVNGKWGIFNPLSSSVYKQAGGWVSSTAVAAGRLYKWDLSGAWNSVLPADRIQFLFASGNIASGTIRIYGIAKT